MSKQYDKILKENIEQVFLPLSEKYLGIKILETRDLTEKLQVTLEREPDFIKIVRTDKQVISKRPLSSTWNSRPMTKAGWYTEWLSIKLS